MFRARHYYLCHPEVRAEKEKREAASAETEGGTAPWFESRFPASGNVEDIRPSRWGKVEDLVWP